MSKENQNHEYLTNKEIEITKLFFSMIKDTKDQFEEYFKLNKCSEEDKAICFYCFVHNLKTALQIQEKGKHK